MTAGLLAAGLVALFATGAAHHIWQQFKQPNPPVGGNSYFRLLTVAGSHRYQYWQVALHAFDTSPLKGIGAGTFRFYWAHHQTLGEYVLNAHSLWIETLAELGTIGLALIAGFFAWVIVRGASHALRARERDRLLAAVTVSAVAAFCAAAAFDWVWQIAVVPVVVMALCAVCLCGLPGADVRTVPAARLTLAGRFVLALGALAALWAISVPLAATVAVRRSQAAAQRGELLSALRYAGDAQQVEPDAATPRLQQALLLEQLGDVDAAGNAIRQAERRSPTDWQIWLVASRIATEQDQPRVALSDWRRAKSLNPRSPIFGG